MKLRVILSVLTGLSLFSALLGAGVYYGFLRENQIQSELRHTEIRAESVKLRVVSMARSQWRSARAMAELPAMARALDSGDPAASAEADAVLDTFAAALEADVCYLMDRNGRTAAASNRDREDSFVGKFYDFRPYFQQAIRGLPAVYMALGVTSDRRGLYFAQPVPGADGPLGVAVVKMPANRMEREVGPEDGIWLLTDPDGMIFAGNREEWRFSFLWPPTPEQRERAAASRQFGPGPWPELGFRRIGPGLAEGPDGVQYRYREIQTETSPGWQVIYLTATDKWGALLRLETPTVRSGSMILAALLLVAISALLLRHHGDREIEKRHRIEADLSESQRRYRAVFENTGAGTVLAEADMTLSMVNGEFARMTGYDRSEIEGKLRWTAFVHPDDHERMKDYHFRRRRGDSDVPVEWECRLLDRAGNVRQAMLRVGLIPGTGTSVGSFTDVTEQRRAERALKESEERYRQFFESDFSGAYISSPDGKLLACNPSFARIFGFSSPEEALAVELRDFYHRAADRILFLDRLRRDGRVTDHETEMVRRDGAVIQTVENAAGFFDAEGRLREIRGYLLDITEKKNLEAQLQQALKMEAVGTLAGGIAHDFNNLLMAIQGCADLMLRDFSEDHPHAEKLGQISAYVRSGASLTSQLLGFARKGRFEPSPLDLHRLVSETGETVARTRKEVTVAYDLSAIRSTVDADRGQIEQLLLNLMINALDAMPEGGRLALSTRDAPGADMTGLIPESEGRNYIRLDVADTGHGMDRRTMKQVFDPFFTTKTLGRGTGLGLASAFGIVKNHGGHIDVNSEPGRGTTFRVFLPTTDRPVVETTPPAEGAPIPEAGTILLVDDEPMIREVGAEMLAAIGFEVEVAASGAEAIAKFRERQSEIRLVILDMIMPEMGGERVFDRLRAIDPGVRVLLSSGYSLEGQARAILERGCDGFIQKPFNLREISGKIRELLRL